MTLWSVEWILVLEVCIRDLMLPSLLCLSPLRTEGLNGLGKGEELSKKLDEMLGEGTCIRLESHPGGSIKTPTCFML